jgi:hypothetical protein
MKQQLTKLFMLAVSAVLVFSACRKNDAPLPDNLVQFTSALQGVDEATNTVTVKVQLSRATDRDIPVVLSVTPSGFAGAVNFTTTPATATGNIALTILSGSSEASFTVTKNAGAVYTGDEKVAFKIISSGTPILIGTANEFTLSFSKIVSTGAATVGNGGGATYGNKVFFDLSGNSQEAVLRTKWDLGFYSGADDWRVIINSSTAMMAKQISKNDLTTVTAADTVGFGADVFFNQSAPTTSSLAYIDYPTGDLSRTAIAAVSATATDNKVYIVNRGTGVGNPAPARGWKKIRVIRNASGGYTLQHADIASTTFTSVDIPKTTTHFFNYASFENGAVAVEPAKEKWDIAWTYFSNITNFGGEVPYLFQDMIIQNRNVSIAKVLVSAKTYEAFTEADLTAQTFTTAQNSIGSSWRAGGGPSSAPAVLTTLFYIIKDGENNYYKLRFTALTQGGERGYPAFEYALVKKG